MTNNSLFLAFKIDKTISKAKCLNKSNVIDLSKYILGNHADPEKNLCKI